MTDINDYKIFARQFKRKSSILPYGFHVYSASAYKQQVIPIMFEWIITNIGSYFPELWQTRMNLATYGHVMTVYFKNDYDALAFKLTWVNEEK